MVKMRWTICAVAMLLLVTTDALAGQVRRVQAFLDARREGLQVAGQRRWATLDVFDVAGGRGFVVTSGDEIVGYCEHGTFSEGLLPDNFRWWLEAMAAEGAEPAAVGDADDDAMPPVAPMLTTAWGQHEPYNDRCPVVDGQRTLTGCVATAMAQVMAYHRHPVGTTAVIPAYVTRSHGVSMPALPSVTFDWSALDAGGSRADAVAADLALYCGQAVQMDYRTDASGSYLAEAAEAFRQYLGYDRDVQHVVATHYTAAEWERLVYDEVAQGRPVIIAGQTPSGGGHAFVANGYDGEGRFFINWGWTGDYDGYFRLPHLKPTASNYSTNQDAVIGIQPPDGIDHAEPPLRLAGRNLAVSGLTIQMLMVNLNTTAGDYDFGYAEQHADGTWGTVYAQRTLAFGVKRGWTVRADVGTFGLSSGTHRLVPVCRLKGTGEWLRLYNSGTYIEARMQSATEGRLLLSPAVSIDQADLVAEVVAADSVAYAFCPVGVTLRLTSVMQGYEGDIYLWPSDRRCQRVAQVSVMPGDTVEVRASIIFEDVGEQPLSVTTSETLDYVCGTGLVTVQPFVETEGLLTLDGPLAIGGTPLQATAAIANDAGTDYVGYLFLTLSRQADDASQWDEVLSMDTLVVIPSGGVPVSVVFPLGDLPDGLYSLDLRCQDFGSYVPYGTTHALTAQPQAFAVGSDVGISQPRAATKKAVRWTLGGRRAAGRTGGVLIFRENRVVIRPQNPSFATN